MQKASPQGLVYKRDVATGNIVQTLRKPAGVDGDAWANYGHIGEVLRKQLTDVRCVKTIGTVNLVQGVSVKALDLFVALQNTALSPMQVVVLTALYQVGPHVGAQHFMDCSAAYRDVMLDLPFPATLRTQGVNVLAGPRQSIRAVTRRSPGARKILPRALMPHKHRIICALIHRAAPLLPPCHQTRCRSVHSTPLRLDAAWLVPAIHS